MDPHTSTAAALANYWDDFADYLETYSDVDTPPEDWGDWLRELFPRSVSFPFGDHHREFWDWVWSIPEPRSARPIMSPGELQAKNVTRPRPFISIWPRGGGKSTAGELAIVACGAREARKYVVIISSSQDQADKRVGEVARKLESESIERYYPSLGQRAIGKFGSAKGWRRNRLHTASGFIVDGLGLDTAARGLKAEDYRPDLLILDDVDERHDTVSMVERKIQTITDTILPMGTMDAAVLGLQNLIIPHGVFARLVSGQADFLVDRIVSGPVPAIRDLEIGTETRKDGSMRTIITGGEAVWEGQDILSCQHAIDTFGISAFLREYQHEVDEIPDALWNMGMIDEFRVSPQDPAIEHLEIVAVGVDPQGSKKEGHETGIVCVARSAINGHVYVLEDGSLNGSPDEWGTRAVGTWEKREADWVVGEANYGGDMVEHTIKTVNNKVPFKLVRATRGKAQRMEPVVALYEQGKVHHVGRFPALESEMITWTRDAGWSPNRIDALVWAIYAAVPELGGQRKYGMEAGKLRM